VQKVLLILLLSGFFAEAKSQTIKGVVRDQLTDIPLNYAIIYIGGTSLGTYSDADGRFELDISRFSSLPVTISLLGYQSVTLTEHNSDNIYKIYLSTKIQELDEVAITGKKVGIWKSRLRIFKREFLGQTENSRDCDILNENDIRFSFNSDSDLLRASCIKPLIIRNKALGYTLEYYLDQFTYIRYSRVGGETGNLSETFFAGNYLFKDYIVKLNDDEKRYIEDCRKKAYLGSRMHFFRSLYLGHLIKGKGNKIILPGNDFPAQSFIISSKTIIDPGAIISKTDSLSGYLRHEGNLYVTYKGMSTTMKLRKDSVFIQKDGYFNPYDVVFQGYMSDQRIGDLLPFEYSLK